MSDLRFIIEFVIEAVVWVAPAFLISVMLGVLIRALKFDHLIRGAFSTNIMVSILLATAIGAFSPFCSCTVVPIVNGMLLSGVPLAPVMAFWIASPTMDPEIFALSVATIGWPLAVARLAASLGLSLSAGFLTEAMVRGKWLPIEVLRREKQPNEVACCPPESVAIPVSAPVLAYALDIPFNSSSGGCGCSVPVAQPIVQGVWWTQLINSAKAIDPNQFGKDVLNQTVNLGRWLVLAFVLEALITLYVPQATIAKVLGNGNVGAIPLAALLGVPMYLSNVTALPIVGGLLEQGMDPGAAIAFLIAGPVTTIPAMMAVWGIVKPRVFGLYLAISLFGAVIAGFAATIVL